MSTIDRRTRSTTDAATDLRIAAMALDQEADACTGRWAQTLRACAAAKRAQAARINQHRTEAAA